MCILINVLMSVSPKDTETGFSKTIPSQILCITAGIVLCNSSDFCHYKPSSYGGGGHIFTHLPGICVICKLHMFLVSAYINL